MWKVMLEVHIKRPSMNCLCLRNNVVRWGFWERSFFINTLIILRSDRSVSLLLMNKASRVTICSSNMHHSLMILRSLRRLEFLIILLIRSNSRSSDGYWLRAVEVVEYAVRSLLVLLQNNLGNCSASRTYSLVSNNSTVWRWWASTYNGVGDLQIFIEDAFQLASDVGVVWHVFVSQAFQVVENVLYFLYVFSHYPKFFFWIIQTFCLNIFNFVHGVFFLFSPFQFLIKEV